MMKLIIGIIFVVIVCAGWTHGVSSVSPNALLANTGSPIYSQGTTPILVQ